MCKVAQFDKHAEKWNKHMPPRHSFQYGKFISGALQTSPVCFHIVRLRKQEAVLISSFQRVTRSHVTWKLDRAKKTGRCCSTVYGAHICRIEFQRRAWSHVMSCHVTLLVGTSCWLMVSLLKCKSSRSAEFAVHPFSKFCIQISSSQFLCAFNASMPVSRWASTTTSASIPQLWPHGIAVINFHIPSPRPSSFNSWVNLIFQQSILLEDIHYSNNICYHLLYIINIKILCTLLYMYA